VSTARFGRKALPGILVLAALLASRPLAAQETGVETPRVFTRYGDQVVKVQVIEAGSSAKASVGSGFFVTDAGDVITNYHVIAQLVHDPERYRAELVDASGATRDVAIVAIDVVYDLAVLRTELRSPRHFVLGAVSVAQGTRLYSLGHPGDLGLSIVEGTFNGLLQHTLYPKIHFTGSINPGMSGGPTITHDGRVIGINVSTAGNQVSFLVPAARAIALLERSAGKPAAAPTELLAEVGRQVSAYQSEYLEGMFAGEGKTVELGPYRAPTEPAGFFRCWGNARRQPNLKYQRVTHSCSTDDYVFIAGDQETGLVDFTHELITTTSLNSFRFGALYTSVFGEDRTPAGTQEHVTNWQCRTRNVRNATTPLRAALCVRRYRKFDGLYDAVLQTAVLGRRNAGLVSTLTLSGVSYDNLSALTTRYLERITWR
jgi:serine protease Do